MSRRTQRLVRALLIVGIGALSVAGLVLYQSGRAAEQTNVLNDGLRGSLPPRSESMPDLSNLGDTFPAIPAPEQLEGRPVALAATCMSCRSGDVLGGFLGRLAAEDIPKTAALHVVVWDGREPGRSSMQAEQWTRRWGLDGRSDVTVHDVRSPRSVTTVLRTFGIGDGRQIPSSGVVYLFDTNGAWRSSWYLGQLDRVGIRHDLQQLARTRSGA